MAAHRHRLPGHSQSPPPADQPQHTTPNNALLGAVRAVRHTSPAPRAVAKDDKNLTRPSSLLSDAAVSVSSTPSSAKMTDSGLRANNTLATPSPHHVPRAKSPSHAAALAATARATAASADTQSRLQAQTTLPTHTRPPVAVKPRRLSSHRSQNIDSPTDTTSIAPTTSLVNLFEQKSSTARKPVPITTTVPAVESIPSPQPLRPSNGLRSLLQNEVGAAQRGEDLQKTASNGQEDIVALLDQTARNDRYGGNRSGQNKGSASRDEYSLSAADSASHQGPDRASGSKAGSPHRQVRAAVDAETRGRQGHQGDFIRAAAQDGIKPALPPRASAKPLPPDRSRSRQDPQPITRTSTAPINIPTIRQSSPPKDLSSSAKSTQSVNAAYRQLYPARQATTLTKGDELANAIVASSLASSRLSSPQRKDPPPLPPSRRHSKHGRSLFHSRTPSPSKAGLRQTLRKQSSSSSSDDEDESHPYNKHRKRRLIRKHPNKHHEGDRKRWRDAVTETERRRYEGVWAANKGLYVSPLPYDPAKRGELNPGDQVSSLVVKDIWSRSRLPENELESVWDLVDSQAAGRLSKEEFVVGMWLIDQRLKGRKLPVKVTATVWASVRGLQGIKVRT